jgi:hypothetical protein
MPVSTPIELSKSHSLGATYAPVEVILITPGAGALARPVRWIRANGAGTVTITTFAGTSVALNFLAGETRFVGATHVTAATATGLEGMV